MNFGTFYFDSYDTLSYAQAWNQNFVVALVVLPHDKPKLKEVKKLKEAMAYNVSPVPVCNTQYNW